MKNEWISVKERLPDFEGRLLVCYTMKLTQVIDAMLYHKKENGFWIYSHEMKKLSWNDYVTHWMPLPEPPKS